MRDFLFENDKISMIIRLILRNWTLLARNEKYFSVQMRLFSNEMTDKNEFI